MTVQELHETDKALLINWLQMAERHIEKLVEENNKHIERAQAMQKSYDEIKAQIDSTNHLVAGQIQGSNSQINELVAENVRLQTRLQELEG